MSRWLLGTMVVVVAGCTAHNPASCSDGSCTDPSLPFCDVDGSLGGQPQTCIAVSCTAGTFAACRGDVAITCNQAGDNYDEIKCDLGCDAASGGCRACMPSTTECANGAVSTCDAAGNVTAQTACPLGCFESEPRCRDIDPSNGLATYLDMVPNPADLDLSMGGTILTDTGVITDSTSQPVAAMTFLVPGVAGAPAIRVIVARNVTLGNVTIAGSAAISPNPLAIVATGDIMIPGVVSVVAGNLTSGACIGGSGSTGTTGTGADGPEVHAAGGGANATAGGTGGTVLDDGGQGLQTPPAAGGTPTGTSAIVPLQGGCASGGSHDLTAGTSSTFGALGGGALQLSSRTTVSVTGSIDASGNMEGGAGGGVLIEAPAVTIGPQGSLLARGGAGAGCSPPTAVCGSQGAGATNDQPAGDGGTVEFNPTGIVAGGGGGGLGRVRVNTPDMTFSTSSSSVEIGQLSTGVLSTR